MSKTQNFYDFLGVSKTATDDEIKKAYRKLAIKYHPDRGGDTAQFQFLQKVNEVLSDPNKRRLYDLGGLDAVERDSRQGGGQRSTPVLKKADPVIFPLSIALEDMLKGAVKKLRLTRSIQCDSCKGEGGTVITCSSCHGRGTTVLTQRMGSVVSQTQQPCRSCQQRGKIITRMCQSCKGQCVTKETATLEVRVPPGARADQTVLFPSAGDQPPGYGLAGDIIVKFTQKQHDTFTRKGHHLFMKQRIALFQALVGFTLYVRHLGGHEVEIKSTGVIKPGDVMCIAEEGFPHSFGAGRGVEVGNLYVEFIIDFPTAQQMSMVKSNPQLLQFFGGCIPSMHPDVRLQPVKGQEVSHPTCSVTSMAREQSKFDTEERQWLAFKETQDRENEKSNEQHDDEQGPEVNIGGCQQM